MSSSAEYAVIDVRAGRTIAGPFAGRGSYVQAKAARLAAVRAGHAVQLLAIHFGSGHVYRATFNGDRHTGWRRCQ